MKNEIGKRLSMTDYYKYKLFERAYPKSKKPQWNPFLHGKRLYHLWRTNQWSKI